MPPLSVVQANMLEALLGRATPDATAFATTPAGFDAALAVHRGTIFGAVANALRLCFPTVDRLVGAPFFDRACGEYLRTAPPRTADLIAYAPGFVDFLAGYEPVRTLRYLADAARLDLALDRASRRPRDAWRCFAIDAHTMLKLRDSTQVLELNYAADDIRAAVESRDEDALGRIDLASAPRWLVIWRTEAGVVARRISASGAVFVRELLSTDHFAAAVEAATEVSDAAAAAMAIPSEVFAAPFSILTAPEHEQ